MTAESLHYLLDNLFTYFFYSFFDSNETDNPLPPPTGPLLPPIDDWVHGGRPWWHRWQHKAQDNNDVYGAEAWSFHNTHKFRQVD